MTPRIKPDTTGKGDVSTFLFGKQKASCQIKYYVHLQSEIRMIPLISMTCFTSKNDDHWFTEKLWKITLQWVTSDISVIHCAKLQLQ